MGTETTKVVLDLDNEEFMTKLKETLGFVGQLGAGSNLDGLKEALLGVGEIVGVVGVAIAAFAAAVKLNEAAEHIKQVEATFQMLAKSAKLASDVIKDDLVTAAGGMAGSVEILESANKAMIVLGDNAKKMPEIMELSRKVIAVMGGELTETFEGLSRAMALGNTRMLRQYGITVDADKATKDFAASIGVGVEFLDAAGKKQAIFNAAMAQSHKKFDDVDVSITATSNSMKKMWTSLVEIKDIAVMAWDAVAGPTVVKMVGQMSDVVHGWMVSMKSMFGTGKEQLDATAESLERQIKQYKILIGQTSQVFNPGQYSQYTRELANAEEKLAAINAKQEKSIQLEMHKAQAEGKKKEEDKPSDNKQFVDQEKLKKAKEKFEADILQLHAARLKEEENLETTAEGFHRIREEQNIQAALKANEEIKKLTQARKVDRVISEEQYADGVRQVQQKLEMDLKKIRLKAQEDELQALKNLEKQNEYTAKGFSASWQRNSKQAAMDLKNFSKLGDQSFHSVGQNAAAAFQAMGDGSKSAGDAMKGFLFGTIGDVAIAQGTMHLLAGIWPPNPIELAEGAALIALGGALKSVGSSSGASAPSAGSVSGSGPSSGDAATAAGQAPAPSATPHKSVSINIHGSLFETDQTRQRLMSMIREAGDYTDFNLKQVGQP